MISQLPSAICMLGVLGSCLEARTAHGFDSDLHNALLAFVAFSVLPHPSVILCVVCVVFVVYCSPEGIFFVSKKYPALRADYPPLPKSMIR